MQNVTKRAQSTIHENCWMTV